MIAQRSHFRLALKNGILKEIQIIEAGEQRDYSSTRKTSKQIFVFHCFLIMPDYKYSTSSYIDELGDCPNHLSPGRKQSRLDESIAYLVSR